MQNPDGTCTPVFTQWDKESPITDLDTFIRKIIDGSETKVKAWVKGTNTASIRVTGAGTTADPYQLRWYKVVCTVDPNDANNVVLTITDPDCNEKSLCMTRVYSLQNTYWYFAQCGAGTSRVNIKFELIQDDDPSKPCHLVLVDSMGNKSTPLDLLSMIKWCVLNGTGNQTQITDIDFKRAVTNCIKNNLDTLFDISDPDGAGNSNITFNGVIIDTFNICAGALACRNTAITSWASNTTKTNLKNYILSCLNAGLPTGLDLFNLWGVQMQTWGNYPMSFQLAGTQLDLTINGVTVASQDISTFIADINVQWFQITNPSAGVYNLVITETDGSTHSVPLWATFCTYINSLAVVNPLLTDTIVASRGGTCIKMSVSGLSLLIISQLTNTIIWWLQNNDSLVDNWDGTYTHTDATGVSMTIDTNVTSTEICTALSTFPDGTVKTIFWKDSAGECVQEDKDTFISADNWLSVWTDGKIELWGVLHQNTTIDTAGNPINILWIPTSTASTVETMWIDTSTGQLVRKESWLQWFEVSNGVSSPIFTNATPNWFSHQILSWTLTLNKATNVFFDLRQNYIFTSQTSYLVLYWFVRINWTDYFPWWKDFIVPTRNTTSNEENDYDLNRFINLPAGTHNITFHIQKNFWNVDVNTIIGGCKAVVFYSL